MSHSPATTSAALPLEEPPADRFGSCGLSTGPVSEVWLPPEKRRCSHHGLADDLSTRHRGCVSQWSRARQGRSPPARWNRSSSGCRQRTHCLLMAIFLPARGPEVAPLIEHLQYQALSRLSEAPGRNPASRGYFTANVGCHKPTSHSDRTFRSTPGSRRSQSRSACLKGTRNGHAQRSCDVRSASILLKKSAVVAADYC
jgi:hypothetical protein